MQSPEDIYKQYAKTVYKFLLALSHDRDIAEELTQETFYQAIRSINRFDGSSKLTTWLFSIAKHQFYDYLRKHPVWEPLPDEDMGVNSEHSAEDAYFSKENIKILLSLIDRLPNAYKEVLDLRIFAGLSFARIGEMLGKSENYARVTYYRGKERLRKELEANEI
ncbi:MAG: sigma-70 family RNA polymerase sigma factor [Lachnospiraceae bacterium]|nr:sigma-70 family RNA polymerase sigma factor [Lachnospiraceae bacterium]